MNDGVLDLLARWRLFNYLSLCLAHPAGSGVVTWWSCNGCNCACAIAQIRTIPTVRRPRQHLGMSHALNSWFSWILWTIEQEQQKILPFGQSSAQLPVIMSSCHQSSFMWSLFSFQVLLTAGLTHNISGYRSAFQTTKLDNCSECV